MDEVNANQADPAEALCPTCGVDVKTHKCRLCGATRTRNQVNGHVIWMRNGRVIRAFTDEKEAYVNMAKAYDIPMERWPERFRSKEK